jgi:hypothetical protein
MNRAAVKAVSMHTLNRQRANIVISTMVASGKVLKPEDVSLQERIFEWDGVLRWKGGPVMGAARIGVPFQRLIVQLGQRTNVTGSISNASIELGRLMELYHEEDYIMWYDWVRHNGLIVLKAGATPTSQLKAWAHVLWVAHYLSSGEAISAESSDEATLQLLKNTLLKLSERWEDDVIAFKAAGWDLGSASLETTSSTRLSMSHELVSMDRKY